MLLSRHAKKDSVRNRSMQMLSARSVVHSESCEVTRNGVLYLLPVSGDVTTGGSVYLIGPDAAVRSPTGGNNVRFVAAEVVGTDVVLSALLLINPGWVGGEPPLLLLRRKRVSTGDTGCDCAIGI